MPRFRRGKAKHISGQTGRCAAIPGPTYPLVRDRYPLHALLAPVHAIAATLGRRIPRMARLAGPSSFLYVAVRTGGGRKFGLRQARSVSALSDSLRHDSLLLLRWWQLPAWAGKDSRLRLKDHAALNDQLAQLLTRGV